MALHVSRHARLNGLPLVADALITRGSGQVLGLGRAAVQRVLADHGISTVLAAEGGRTSRGSIKTMRTYVAFLNRLHDIGLADLEQIEAWWSREAEAYFPSKPGRPAKPFRLRFDAGKGLQAIVQDLLAQAKKRQQEATGAMYQGAVLQHLIGAKLELALPELSIVHHGFSVADAVTDRSGDFVIDNTTIHVTTAPGEAVIRKCLRNLEAGCKPVILTLVDGVVVAKALANNAGLVGQIDIMDAEQFLAANLHELSLFNVAARLTTLEKLVSAYNRIVESSETDPSLRIEMG